VVPKKIINHAKGPEDIVQEEIVKMLTLKGWFVKETHGNMYQSGFPDLFACHSLYRQRWIECKLPKGSRLEESQLRDFPKLCANGSGVWILTAATEEQYNLLFQAPNWWHFLMHSKSANPTRYRGLKDGL
jgi:hypothetical protein